MQKAILLPILLACSFACRAQEMPRVCPDCWDADSLSNHRVGGSAVMAPKTPIRLGGDTLIILPGRTIRLNQQGFPEQIQTHFTGEVNEGRLLAENIHYHFTRQADGKDIRLKAQGLQFVERSPGILRWQAASTADELRMDVSAVLEGNGFLGYTVRVAALQDLDLKDIVMHIPFQKEMTTYLVGLGRQGGYRPDSMVHWKWDGDHGSQGGAWIGVANGGLEYSLVPPASWANGGKGGIDIGIKGKSMLANNYSGARPMKKGDVLELDFNLFVTGGPSR
jgi:hypothetical protein